MGIQSTIGIDRDDAICRIRLIGCLVSEKAYRRLEDACFEPNMRIETFVDDGLDFSLSGLDEWTCTMLENKMGEPFYRFSMYDNYNVS